VAKVIAMDTQALETNTILMTDIQELEEEEKERKTIMEKEIGETSKTITRSNKQLLMVQ